jgi:Uncharacterized protein conserved in bacteria (DUF2252)
VDSTARGRATRKRTLRAEHADAGGAADRDPVALLQAQDASRLSELLPIRYGRMGSSPFAFFRGAATIMAHDLAAAGRTDLTVQLCGDARSRCATSHEQDYAELQEAACSGRVVARVGL